MIRLIFEITKIKKVFENFFREKNKNQTVVNILRLDWFSGIVILSMSKDTFSIKHGFDRLTMTPKINLARVYIK